MSIVSQMYSLSLSSAFRMPELSLSQYPQNSTAGPTNHPYRVLAGKKSVYVTLVYNLDMCMFLMIYNIIFWDSVSSSSPRW